MKKFNLGKMFMVYLMIFSLVQTTMPYPAQAQSIESNPAFEISKMAMGVYGQMLGQKQQIVMQQIQMQKNQQMMQQLSPNCRKPDGTSCFTVQGKFFPECPLPASMSNMPENACISASPDPAQISSMITFESVAKNWVNYYDQMSNEASNSAVPFGLKCLQDKQKAVDSQITEMINNLTRLQDRLNQDKQVFRDNNKKLLEDLALANEELFGGPGKKDLGLKTADFSKYFSPACQSAIGKETMSEARRIGFNGILETLSPKNKSAADYNQNRALIESDVRRDIEKMQVSIQKSGLADWLNNVKGPMGADISSLPTVKAAGGKHLMEFETSSARIQAELKKEFGYDLPKMDKNFATDFGSFLTTSKDHFRKKFINECVTGADKGIAIPLEDILRAMTTRIQGSVGVDYLNNYRNDYKSIVESEISIEEKKAKLADLNKLKPDISLTYRNASGQIMESPYTTFMKTAAKCEEKFVAKDATTVNRGQALLREIQEIHDNFTSNLGQAVMEKVMNCNGEAKKSGAACNEETLSHKSEGFCMAQANQCANEIIGCYAEANKHVEARKAKMGTLAQSYNKNVAAMVARSNQLFEQQKIAVTELTKAIQARFPGTNFEIPADMFIAMPELKKDAFGVELVNDGNLSFMEELPKKIGLLKQMFDEQKSRTNDVIEDYIAKQRMAMDRERGRWDRLASECKGHIERSSQELAKMNNERMKQQNEMDMKVGNWCRKYSELKSHPNVACEKAKKLTEDMDKVAAYLTKKAQNVASEFNDVCNSFNNNKEDDNLSICSSLVGSDDEDDKKLFRQKGCRAIIARAEKTPAAKSASRKTLKMKTLCKDTKDASDSEVFQKFAELNPKDKEALSGVSSLSDLNDSVLEKLENPEFYEGLMELAAGKSSICAALAEADKGSSFNTDVNENEIKETNQAIAAAKAELEKLKNTTQQGSLRALEQQNSILREKEARLLELEKQKAQAKTNGTDKNQAKELLSSFFPPPPTSEELELSKISDLGERVDESCNAQASNNMMPKGFNSFNLQQYDQSILGKSK